MICVDAENKTEGEKDYNEKDEEEKRKNYFDFFY